MAPPTFVQESRVGRVIFQIRDGALYISTARLGGALQEYRVDLRRLNPNYRPKTARLTFQLLVSGLFAVLCALALWGLYQQTAVPQGAMGYITYWPLIGFFSSLVTAIRASSRVEYFQFSDHWGKPVFSVVRERQQAADCATFILSLVSHIELAQADLPAVERNSILSQLARENPSVPQKEVAAVPWWKLSLVLGTLAAGIPWVPQVDQYFAGAQFLMVFGFCVGGACCCAASYQRKEARRHWSLPGLVLSLVPPFFY